MPPSESISVTEDERSLPVENLLTGRGFVTGKSGSGKSNTASVIVEALLDAGHPLFVVDTEGEYYGLKEDYSLLHAGADDTCDVVVDEGDAPILATVVFEYEYPVVLDVSGYFDIEDAKALIERTLAELFRREKEYRKPTLLVVEEIQEYLPQQGGSDDLSKLLLRIAKRGRKRGLGMCGLSQRPSAVDKDFITQCDWMIWHRLTWETDVDLVKRILGGDVADQVVTLDTGEAFLMTDWNEDVDQVKFNRKQTFDAGATPSIGEEYEEPSFQPVDPDVVSEFDPGKRHADVADSATTDAERTETAAAGDGGVFTGAGVREADDSAGDDPAADDSATGEADDDGAAAGSTEEANDEEVAELRAAFQRERERNDTLQAEVAELRELLDERAELPDRTDADLPEAPEAAENGDPLPDPTAGRRSPPLDDRRQSRPEEPAGILVELGQMIAHLIRWLSGTVYRLSRRVATRAGDLRGGRSSHPGPLGHEPTAGGRTIGGSTSLWVQIAVVVGLLAAVGLASLAVLLAVGAVSL